MRPQPSVLTRGAGDRSPTLSSLCACTLKVYAAFTTLASFLALAVELQHGGRDLAETWPRPRRDLDEMQHGGRLPVDAEHRVRAFRPPLELG